MTRFNIDNGLPNPARNQEKPFILADLTVVLLETRDRLPFITAPDKIPGLHLAIVPGKSYNHQEEDSFWT